MAHATVGLKPRETELNKLERQKLEQQKFLAASEAYKAVYSDLPQGEQQQIYTAHYQPTTKQTTTKRQSKNNHTHTHTHARTYTYTHTHTHTHAHTHTHTNFKKKICHSAI